MADILVVEDNPADVKLLREALRQSRVIHTLRVVADGAAAIELLSSCGLKDCPDLILLDLNLPHRSGHEVLAAIRSNPMTASVPVIVMSSSQDSGDVAKAYDALANCFIVKPVDLDDLVRVVRAIDDFWFTVAELPTH